jgi:hypothetical protein
MQAIPIAHPSTKNKAGHARTVWLVRPTVAAKCNILLPCDCDVSRFATRPHHSLLAPRFEKRLKRLSVVMAMVATAPKTRGLLGLRRRKSGMSSAGLGRAGARSGAASPKRSAPQNAVHRLRTACAMRCTAWRGYKGGVQHSMRYSKNGMRYTCGTVCDAVTCAPVGSSRAKGTRREQRVPCQPGTAAPLPRPARAC